MQMSEKEGQQGSKGKGEREVRERVGKRGNIGVLVAQQLLGI